MAQDDKPANKMGDVINNQGIVSQGQIGNNYIIVAQKPPSVSIISESPPVKRPDGLFTLTTLIRLTTQFTPNALMVSVNKDVVAPLLTGPSVGRALTMVPAVGGAVVQQHGSGTDNTTGAAIYVAGIKSPVAGDYNILTWVKSPDIKPSIKIWIE